MACSFIGKNQGFVCLEIGNPEHTIYCYCAESTANETVNHGLPATLCPFSQDAQCSLSVAAQSKFHVGALLLSRTL